MRPQSFHREKKRGWAITALLLLLVIGQRASGLDFPERFREAALKATVRMTFTLGSKNAIGTGSIIGADSGDVFVLTAEHVLHDGAPVQIQFWPHGRGAMESRAMTVVGRMAAEDLAIIRVPAPKNIPGQLPVCPANRCPSPPFRVLTVGCSDGKCATCQAAEALKVGQIKSKHGTAPFWIVDYVPRKGRSGGAMICPSGHLVGVCSAGSESKAFYGCLEKIYRLLDGAGLAKLYQGTTPPLPQMPVRLVALRASAPTVLSTSWSDPGRFEAEANINFQLYLDSASPVPFPYPIELHIEPKGDVHVLAEHDSVMIAGVGTVEVNVALRALLRQPERTVKLIVRAGHLPGLIALQPQSIELTITLSRPGRVATRVAASAFDVGTPEWIDLYQGLARFEAEIQVDVTGPLGDRSTLALAAPPGIRTLDLNPSTIRSGKQTVQMEIVASLQPAPAVTEFVFEIETQSRGAIDIATAGPLRINVPGPPPLHLALAEAGASNRPLSARLPQRDSAAMVTVTPVLLGVPIAQAPADLCARFSIERGMRIEANHDFPLFRRSQLCIQPDTKLPTGSFFRDTVRTAKVNLTSVPCLPTIVGSTHTVSLRQEAPFKTLVMLIAVVVFGAIVLCVPIRFFWRLQSEELVDFGGSYDHSHFKVD